MLDTAKLRAGMQHSVPSYVWENVKATEHLMRLAADEIDGLREKCARLTDELTHTKGSREYWRDQSLGIAGNDRVMT